MSGQGQIVLLLRSAAVLTLAACAHASGGSVNAHSRLVIVAEEAGRIDPASLLVEVLRYRLPVSVQRGTPETNTNICVSARRNRPAAQARLHGSLNACSMIAVVLDGIHITNADASVWNSPIGSFESIELLSASDAMSRYGINGGEALELWTKGSGPFARGKREKVSLVLATPYT